MVNEIKGSEIKGSDPIIAHIPRNGELSPNDVTVNSGKKVWWRCTRGYEWQATITSRNYGRGCSYCSKKKKNRENKK